VKAPAPRFSFTFSLLSVNGSSATEGQEKFLEDVNRVVLDAPDHLGKGVFWWEPAISSARSGGLPSRSFFDNFDNFDNQGNGLPVVSVCDQPAQK